MAARPLLSWCLGLPEFRRLYAQALDGPGETFATRALDVLRVGVVCPAAGDTFPETGPLIVAANHPHGLVDGLAMAHLVARTRRDVRVMTNDLLASLPALQDVCLFVHAFERRAAGQTRRGLRAALRWLQEGHALVIFPAGAVAHDQWQLLSTPADGPWRDTVGRLARRSGAAVVPAHIAGRNRDWFYRAGVVNPALRTVLLGRELLAKRGQQITIRLGRPLVLARHDARTHGGEGVTALLRAHVEQLADAALPTHAAVPAAVPVPVAPSGSGEALQREVAQLPPACQLLQSGRFEVYCAPAAAMPLVLHEIGRLRELTFRDVGEGTGRALDLDRFDQHYLHLFVWDREAGVVAGAYRLGCLDAILPTRGIAGLYTSTLYRYDAELLSRLGPAIELGRSFVRAEYQRSSNTLLLLWKGIARFVLQSGRYRVLFGPVSISARYSDRARHLVQAYLRQHARQPDLAPLVTAVHPPHDDGGAASVPATVAALDRQVAGLEPDGKGVPVLLRQYLRLNAKLLAFNVDPEFSHALDALMMVDLAAVDRAILARYFGPSSAGQLVRAEAA